MPGSSYAARIGDQYERQFGRPASADNPDYAQYVQTALPAMINSDRADLERSQARWGIADKLAMGAAVAIPTLGLSSILGGGASAAAPVSHSYSSPGVFSGLFGGGGTAAPAAATATQGISRLGSILTSPALQTGVNAGLGIAGMVTQSRANAQARSDALAAQTRQIELEQARLAEQARNADLDRADAKALNDRIQALEEKKFQLAQEQAQYDRTVSEETRANTAQDRAYLNDYRARIQGPAAQRMASILGF